MFGQIAAANALSDIFAMGGIPKTAMNIVAFPVKKLGAETLAEILKGASDKVIEAGAVTIGGHSIDDQEPKFGLSVTGTVHPEQVWKNIGARPGDVIVITKPIGVGIMTTGIKRQAVTDDQERIVTEVMATLNKKAAEALHHYSPHAVTDITGFGFLGHGSEMAKGSGVSFEISLKDVPILEGTHNLAHNGVVPGGSKSNHKWLEAEVDYSDIPIEEQLILCDAVTSGGFLIALSEEEGQKYIADLHKLGIRDAAIVGKVIESKEKLIYVKR